MVSGSASFTGSAVGAFNPGSYTITPSPGTLSAANYQFTPFSNGTLTITDATAPLVSNTQALPVALSTTGTVTSTISDATTGGSNIKSWYYTVDGAPSAVINIASPAVTVNVSAPLGPYTTTDVKEICVYGTDAANNTSLKDCVLLAVYDPRSGFVTGGGWIMSPLGAYTLNPSLSGKATFGFVSKYVSGKTVPTGNTEFQFHEAGMNFSSTVYEWLVVSGSMAQYKGSGTINGAGNYGFLLSAVDGDLTGGGGADKFRVKIWDKATGNVVYDNLLGTSDTATPTTVIGGGSIVIHK